MTRNQLDEEVDKWHSIVSEVVGKHSKTVLVRPRNPTRTNGTQKNSGKSARTSVASV